MKKWNYYNDFDPSVCEWVRELIAAKLVPDGEVDQRSIADVHSSDLKGFVQCHFFCGILGWPLALQLAGWPADRPIWTGSCPCQSFSSAGRGLDSQTPEADCGNSSTGSSASRSLQLSLANRLKRRLATGGSIEYRMTWKDRITPAGRPYCLLRASAPRTSEAVSSGPPLPLDGESIIRLFGWPSPRTPTGGAEGRESKDSRGSGGVDLQTVSQMVLSGYPTPTVPNGGRLSAPDYLSATGSGTDGKKRSVHLNFVVNLMGWTSPSSRDWKDSPGMATTATNPDGSERTRLDQLPRQVGLITLSSTAETAATGESLLLNPWFSGWLMGYPPTWLTCGLTAAFRSAAASKGGRRCSKASAIVSFRSLPPSSSEPLQML